MVTNDPYGEPLPSHGQGTPSDDQEDALEKPEEPSKSDKKLFRQIQSELEKEIAIITTMELEQKILYLLQKISDLGNMKFANGYNVRLDRAQDDDVDGIEFQFTV